MKLVTLGIIVAIITGLFLFGQSSMSIQPGSTLAACPSPSAKALIFCNVAGDPSNPDGAYVSANGAKYFQVPQSTAGGVTSWNGMTGAVTYAPSSISCTTAQQSNSGLTASGCTIK